jgi:hypothetical protein
MNKTNAKKLQAGDQVFCTHDRKTYTVASVILKSPDRHDKVPLIVTTDGSVITHAMLKRVG